MTILQGKGMYLWRIKNAEGGNPHQIAQTARDAGLTHVLIKVADGRGSYNTYTVRNGREYFNAPDGTDHVPALVAALRARGISPWGWQYIYGHYPSIEARKAIQRVKQFNLDGFVVNAEIEFEQGGMATPAKAYMRELRTGLPNTPIALSSYRYPNVHRAFPWETFLEYCDLNMPQVYWVRANNPAAQLLKSLHEFQSLKVWRPVFPTGAAYGEHGWRATPEQVTSFLHGVQNNGLAGCNFWEWSFARQKESVLWDRVKAFPWEAGPGKEDIAIRYLDALNSNDPVRVTALYSQAGVHVTGQRSVQGPEGILEWYNTLFKETMPNAHFTITGHSQTENIKTLTWAAESSTGRVLDGKDSFGVKDDQIAYHYTFFTIQPS